MQSEKGKQFGNSCAGMLKSTFAHIGIPSQEDHFCIGRLIPAGHEAERWEQKEKERVMYGYNVRVMDCSYLA